MKKTNSPSYKPCAELSECNLLESVQETFYVVCWLVLQDFYAAFHLEKRNEQNVSTGTPELHLKPEPCSDVQPKFSTLNTHVCAHVCLTSILEDLLKAPLGWT